MVCSPSVWSREASNGDRNRLQGAEEHRLQVGWWGKWLCLAVAMQGAGGVTWLVEGKEREEEAAGGMCR